MSHLSSLRSGTLAMVAVVALAQSANAVQFLATDGNMLYRADSSGSVQAPVTISAALQTLTILPAGYALPGASAGDIICGAASATSGRYNLYRMVDPMGSATLVKIGSMNQGIGSLVFANGKMYGVDDSLNTLRVYEIDMATGNVAVTHNTGIGASGGGGLAYNSATGLFYLTDYNNHRLYKWTGSGSATLVGNIGFGFANNGVEFANGVMYGALRTDTGNNLRFGSFDLTTGAFTTLATAANAPGNGTGFVAVPEPMTALGFALGVAALARRRRR